MFTINMMRSIQIYTHKNCIDVNFVRFQIYDKAFSFGSINTRKHNIVLLITLLTLVIVDHSIGCKVIAITIAVCRTKAKYKPKKFIEFFFAIEAIDKQCAFTYGTEYEVIIERLLRNEKNIALLYNWYHQQFGHVYFEYVGM